MTTFNIKFISLLAGCLTIGTLVSGVVVADSRDSSTGYTSDGRGNIVRSGAGECVQTGSFDKGDATIVGCDDYVLDTKITVIKGEGLDAVTMISFPQAELFAFDSDQMTDAGKAYIDGYRDELGNDLAQAYSVTVIGYTDSTGDADYNMNLSKRRADAVAAYMVSIGVPADKIRTLGRGENDPIASNDTSESRAQNRRVEAIIVGQPRALDAMIFPSVALFERRSAAITSQGEKLLQQNMQDAREQFKRSAYIEVVGHTDDVGDDAYNLDLSQQRAEAVGTYLANAGIDPSKIIMIGAGESSPITSNATDEGRAENRRVEVMLLGRTR